MILALAGGVGGAKLACGLTRVLAPEDLLIAVNTGDDFQHLGLHISPDLDSVMYKLAGLNDVERGWGLAEETWQFMTALRRLGGETWFNLGDQDLATHLERTRRLGRGETLSDVTRILCTKLGIEHPMVPMSDDAVRTMVITDEGLLPFQDYFVRRKCEPVVTGFAFDGAETARPNEALMSALGDSNLDAVVICPSNPFVSIDPIFALRSVASALENRTVPVVAISPIISGMAVKGPAAKMFGEMGMKPSASAISRHYGDRIDGLIIDSCDAHLAGDIEETGTKVHIVPTLMKNTEDEQLLAKDVLAFAEALKPRKS